MTETVVQIQRGGTGASSASGARTALGLVIGTDVQAYDADTAKTDVAQSFTKAQGTAQVSLTSSANSVATDASFSNSFYHALTENTTLAAPSNLVSGFWYSWEFVQDSTARTLAFNTIFKFANSLTPSISVTSGAKLIVSGYYDGTNINCTFAQNFA